MKKKKKTKNYLIDLFFDSVNQKETLMIYNKLLSILPIISVLTNCQTKYSYSLPALRNIQMICY